MLTTKAKVLLSTFCIVETSESLFGLTSFCCDYLVNRSFKSLSDLRRRSASTKVLLLKGCQQFCRQSFLSLKV
ncbi:unnamed protein product [Cuscuta campestris]|uniref:Uncharacterized protein n=1 Tax=Cuscuta campestris TaxID=132261 RepID=A0A484NH89_9ASTE|nr:unnamed protein product [Cuscuta campestris]